MAQAQVATDTTKELVELYRRADADFKEIIFTMLTLTGKYGDPFLEETKEPALAGDREALKAVFRKWEAKAEETQP